MTGAGAVRSRPGVDRTRQNAEACCAPPKEMSFLIHENKHWPLALTVARGRPSLRQHRASIKCWDAWFASARPFHVIRFFADADSIQHPPGAAKATKDWLAAGAASQFRALLKSMLIIVPPEQYPRMQKMSVRKAFGIPGQLCASLDEAFRWIENPPEPLDGPAIRQGWQGEIKQTLNAYLTEF